MQTMPITQLASHIDRISTLAQLGHSYQAEQYFLSLPDDSQSQLYDWCCIKLQKKILSPSKIQASHVLINAWDAYYQHDYINSHEMFCQAWQLDLNDDEKMRIALGLGKIYTRSGHWQAARDWTLYALKIARQIANTFDIAKGYGALAEIFLRANAAKEALCCFQIAYHMMPHGQAQQARQLNFIASALMRNQEWLRAENLLYTSKQISRNQIEISSQNQDPLNSLIHSQLRLEYIHYLTKKEPQHVPELHDLLEKSPTQSEGFTVPYAHLLTVRAMSVLYHKNDPALAVEYLDQAVKTSKDKAVMENQWISHLKAAVLQEKSSLHSDYLKLIELEPLVAPSITSVIDQVWTKQQLTNQGFLALKEPPTTVQDIFKLWHIFFI